MAYTYEQFNSMTVGELRKIADGIDHEAVHGHATMHKEKLVPALCTALGIESHVHHQAKISGKSSLKLEIRSLKKKRTAAISSKDYAQLRDIRRHIHDIKVKLRASIKKVL
jgi:cysteinyl-tRNA synthetase